MRWITRHDEKRWRPEVLERAHGFFVESNRAVHDQAAIAEAYHCHSAFDVTHGGMWSKPVTVNSLSSSRMGLP
jgi:hypothetical protein